jgi:hypothetical protein
MQISCKTGVCYNTVLKIINKLDLGENLRVCRYKRAPKENGIFAPHAMITLRGYTRRIENKHKWLKWKFGRQRI